jgi:hypothetical protein
MCGGSKTVYNTTETQSVANADLPAWAKPYFERNIGRAEAEFSKPYEAYTGQRLAGTDPNVARSREMVEGIAGSGMPGLELAQDYTVAGMDRAAELGQYGPGQFSAFEYTQPQTFTGDAVSQYMSPYQQNVLDVQKDRAVRDFNRLQSARDAQAVKAGAFGGSRQAVQQGLAEESLLDLVFLDLLLLFY